MHFQGSQLYPGRPRSGHILQAHLSLCSPLPSTGQQYREAIQAIQYTQRLLLRLPGRRPSLHQKGYEAIHKWGSEREPANPERKQQNRTRQQGPVLRTCPECGLSEGRLTLELSVLPPPSSYHMQICTGTSHLHGESCWPTQVPPFTRRSGSSESSPGKDSKVRALHRKHVC